MFEKNTSFLNCKLKLPPLAVVGDDQPLLQELAEVVDAFQVAPPSLQRTKAGLGQTDHYWQAWQGSDGGAPPPVAFSVGESVCGLGWPSYPGPSSSGPDLDPDPDLEPDLEPDPDLEA